MLVHAIVIASNGARTNIDALTYVGVAHVGKMICLTTFTKIGIFNFNKITHVRRIRQLSAGAQACIRSNVRIRTHLSLLQMTKGLDARGGS